MLLVCFVDVEVTRSCSVATASAYTAAAHTNARTLQRWYRERVDIVGAARVSEGVGSYLIGYRDSRGRARASVSHQFFLPLFFSFV